MSFGERPVASYRKRSVYKTEFDIFKQNSELDLISLVSFDEDKPLEAYHTSDKRARAERDHFIKNKVSTSRYGKSYQPQVRNSIILQRNNREKSVNSSVTRSQYRNSSCKTNVTRGNVRDNGTKSAIEFDKSQIGLVDDTIRSKTACGFRNPPQTSNTAIERNVNAKRKILCSARQNRVNVIIPNNNGHNSSSVPSNNIRDNNCKTNISRGNVRDNGAKSVIALDKNKKDLIDDTTRSKTACGFRITSQKPNTAIETNVNAKIKILCSARQNRVNVIIPNNHVRYRSQTALELGRHDTPSRNVNHIDIRRQTSKSRLGLDDPNVNNNSTAQTGCKLETEPKCTKPNSRPEHRDAQQRLQTFYRLKKDGEAFVTGKLDTQKQNHTTCAIRQFERRPITNSTVNKTNKSNVCSKYKLTRATTCANTTGVNSDTTTPLEQHGTKVGPGNPRSDENNPKHKTINIQLDKNEIVNCEQPNAEHLNDKGLNTSNSNNCEVETVVGGDIKSLSQNSIELSLKSSFLSAKQSKEIVTEDKTDVKYSPTDEDLSKFSDQEELFDSKDSGYGSNNISPEIDEAKLESVEHEVLIRKPTEERLVSFQSNYGIEDLESKSDLSSNFPDIESEDFDSYSQIDENRAKSRNVVDVSCFIHFLESRNDNHELGNENDCQLTSRTEDKNSIVEDIDESASAVEVSDNETESSSEDCPETDQEQNKNAEDTQKVAKTPQDITMSKEARHAILETLHDMQGVRRDSKTGLPSAEMRYKGVTTQKRQTDNRHKYNHFMRERTQTFVTNQRKHSSSTVKLNDENGSAFSENIKECDNSSNEENYKMRKLFPSIGEDVTSRRRPSMATSKTSSGQVDHAKKKKYKIPGIGNYDMVMSPKNNDFEITPPGFDSRYNSQPIISKEEMELPPQFIQDQSVLKCKKWLKNVSLSPLSLNPVVNKI